MNSLAGSDLSGDQSLKIDKIASDLYTYDCQHKYSSILPHKKIENMKDSFRYC